MVEVERVARCGSVLKNGAYESYNFKGRNIQTEEGSGCCGSVHVVWNNEIDAIEFCMQSIVE